MARWKELVTRVLAWGRGLSRSAQLLLGLGVAAAVLAAVLMVLMNQPRFVPLYSGLDLADAARITEKLGEQGVPYRLRDEGHTVLVPAQQVYDVRLKLAGDGLPSKGTVGFEILDKPPLGATESDRRLAYLRALQGELARTIGRLEGVEEARVHIVVPEPQLFASQERPVTAAVLLKVDPRAQLSPEQVRGIVHLVTHSVEGLRPDGVSVVDQYGRVLSAQVEDGSPSATADHLLEVQRQFQADLERRLQSLLEQVLGVGNAVTRVAAELNFDSRTVERQLFEPGPADGVLRSIQELEETFAGPASSAPPAGGGIPGYQAGGQEGPASYHRREVTRNLEVGQVREHMVVMPGGVRRLSVAVVVNRELEPAQQEAITRLVAAAIGSDPNRQDQITVLGIPFAPRWVDLEEGQPPARPAPARLPDWRYLAAGGGGVTVLMLAWWMGRRRRRRVTPAPAPSEPAPAPAEAAEPPAQPAPEEPVLVADEARLRLEVEKLARKSPETVAQLIRAWMAEE